MPCIKSTQDRPGFDPPASHVPHSHARSSWGEGRETGERGEREPRIKNEKPYFGDLLEKSEKTANTKNSAEVAQWSLWGKKREVRLTPDS